MRGLDIRREWSESQMLTAFGGMNIPGTPDGMYEDWDGRVTCVQVVRVPFSRSMRVAELEEVYYRIVLVKAYKSQIWMRATRMVPHEFIIFTWLPFDTPEGLGGRAQQLIKGLQDQGWPFKLRCMIPEDSSALFPARFA